MALNCTACEEAIYSGANYASQDPFPLAHVVLPLQFYFVFQNVWLTLFSIYLFESVQVIERALCYSGWLRLDPFECNGNHCDGLLVDSLIADVIQGFLGIFLAILLFTVIDVPQWTLSFRESMASWTNGLWWKRVLFYALLYGSSAFNYLRSSSTLQSVGVGLWAIAVTGVFVGFYFWNKTDSERRSFWTESNTGTFQHKLYAWTYLGMAMTSLGIILAWFLPISDYIYVNFAVAYSVIWLALVVYGIAKGHWCHIADLHTFGLYSSCTRQRSDRFRHDKDRYLQTQKTVSTVAASLLQTFGKRT